MERKTTQNTDSNKRLALPRSDQEGIKVQCFKPASLRNQGWDLEARLETPGFGGISRHGYDGYVMDMMDSIHWIRVFIVEKIAPIFLKVIFIYKHANTKNTQIHFDIWLKCSLYLGKNEKIQFFKNLSGFF